MKLTIGDFKCHEDVVYEIPDKGLVLLRGESGTGKTTLLDAILFALFGKENSTKSRRGKCFVALEDSKRGILIERSSEKTVTVTHGDLTLTSGEANAHLEEVYGRQEAFLLSSLSRQGCDSSILSEGQANKKTFFEGLVGDKREGKERIGERTSFLDGEDKRLAGKLSGLREAKERRKELPPLVDGVPLPEDARRKAKELEKDYEEAREKRNEGRRENERRRTPLLRAEDAMGRRNGRPLEGGELEEAKNHLGYLSGRLRNAEEALKEGTKASALEEEASRNREDAEVDKATDDKESKCAKARERKRISKEFSKRSAIAKEAEEKLERASNGALGEEEEGKLDSSIEEMRFWEGYFKIARGKSPGEARKQAKGRLEEVEREIVSLQDLSCPSCDALLGVFEGELVARTEERSEEGIDVLEMKGATIRRDLATIERAFEKGGAKKHPKGALGSALRRKEASRKAKEEVPALALALEVANSSLKAVSLGYDAAEEEGNVERAEEEARKRIAIVRERERKERRRAKERLDLLRSAVAPLAKDHAKAKEEVADILAILNAPKLLFLPSLEERCEELEEGLRRANEEVLRAEIQERNRRERAEAELEEEELGKCSEEASRIGNSLWGSKELGNCFEQAELISFEEAMDEINGLAEVHVRRLLGENSSVTLYLKDTRKDGKPSAKTTIGAEAVVEGRPARGVKNLSAGERQRANLAFLLAANEDLGSDFLFLDECLNNLDKDNNDKALKLLRRSFPDKTILVISHEAVEGSFDEVIDV